MTPTATITFDQLERDIDRTRAYALLIRASQAYVECLYRTWRTTNGLERLTKRMTAEMLGRLTQKQAADLVLDLQELHQLTSDFSNSPEAARSRDIPVLAGLIRRFQERTEDLGDIIEDLTLMHDPDFKNLVSACTASLGLVDPHKQLAGLQD
jgi:hypothetical protein